MNDKPEISDLTMQDRSVQAQQAIRFVCLWETMEDRLISMSPDHTQPKTNAVSAAFRRFAQEYHDVLISPSLLGIVVIEGISSAVMYDVGRFRHLCGVAPDPQRNDKDWLG